jgi:hypothetical protein
MSDEIERAVSNLEIEMVKANNHIRRLVAERDRLLKVAEAAKAYYSLASGPYDDTREGEFLELQAELGKALSEPEAQ